MALLGFLFWMALNGRVTGETVLPGLVPTALAMVFLCKACSRPPRKEGRLYQSVLRPAPFPAPPAGDARFAAARYRLTAPLGPSPKKHGIDRSEHDVICLKGWRKV